MYLRRLALLLATCLATLAFAAGSGPADLPSRVARLYVTYTVNPDGSRVETRETAITILTQQAVEYGKQASVSHSTSVERAEILEAYTLKADGRRIEVPKSNYQLDINKGRDEASPAFSDRTRITIIFPDVAVKDTLVYKYRIAETEPMFPGKFSVDERFSRYMAYDDVRVRFDAPAGMWTQHSVTDMASATDESRDGRRILEWTWKNPAPPRQKRAGYRAYNPDAEPGYAFSTFRSHAEIAEAYWERARPKAVPSDRVRALAEEIAKSAKGQREQARALYEWVATNIHYAGNCVGVGAVVPRDQSFVLDNKMGDCKDQATLLQALLAARGIASTQALVNSGQTYRLPKVPVVSQVNHVIVYVPGLDLYLDPTSSTTPFGMLPLGDCDKPVLLVEGFRDGARTPPLKSAANRQVTKSSLAVKADGSIGGVIDVTSSGLFAVTARDAMRLLTPQQKDELLERMFKRDNKTGFGRLENDDPKPLKTDFSSKLTFETEEFAEMPGPGAFTIGSMSVAGANLYSVLDSTDEEEIGDETSCFGGTLVEEFVFRLPKGMKVIAIPKNVSLSNATVTYKATYSLKGGVLSARREFVDRTDRNVCPGAVQKDFVKLSRKIAQDLKAQVVYQ